MELIKEKLNEIEKKYNVKIIFAVDNGSNAYGIASKNSDIDLRFLYVETIENYLRLGREKDVIEIIDKENNIEYKGFSLDKFLKLLSKSNPSILEELNSPISYLEKNKFERIVNEIKELSIEFFSMKRCLFHYTGNAVNDLKKIKETLIKVELDNKKSFVKLMVKKVLSVFRALLVCEYIINEKRYPITSNFTFLMDNSLTIKKVKFDETITVYELLKELISLKKECVGYFVIEKEKFENFLEFINNSIDEYRDIANELKDKAIDFKKINDYYIKVLKEINNVDF